jgi:uncharacterized protein YgiM (DUF1202 family)
MAFNNFKQLIFLFLLLTFTTLVYAGGKVWVTASGAVLKKDMNASAATVTSVAIGTELSVLKTSGKWYQVSTPTGKVGWIYSGKISTAPLKKSGSTLGSLTGSSSIKLSSADTSRSIRGLSPEAKEYANSVGTPIQYQQALDNVLSINTTSAQINSFLKEGQIGEYAY